MTYTQHATRVVFVFLLASGFFLSFFSLSHAAVIRTGDIVTVPADATVPADFYALGSDITISGVIEGDLYAVGKSIVINGTVKGDVFAVGASVSVHGETLDDVRVVGGKVILADATKGDAMILGGFASILSTASIGEDVFFYGGRLDTEGIINGALHARAEQLVINASVGALEDLVISQELLLGDSAHIKGSISYESSQVL